MLEALGLGCGRQGRLILRDVSLTLSAGELVAVLGSNGAGKSTLLSALGGELAPLAGTVKLNGQSLASWSDRERARVMAVLPQHSSLAFAFSGRQVVALGRLPHLAGARRDEQAISCAMMDADVTHLADRSFLRMSGGERQRIHLARVLAQLADTPNPCLLLDEPTAALDLAHQQAAMQAVSNLAQRGGAVLVATHDLNLAARYADRIILLHDGQVADSGTPWQVLRAERIEQVFGIRVQVQRHPSLDRPLIIL